MSYALQNWLLQVTVLHVAAKHSTASAVTALIDAGAEVEAQSSFKSRPLHWAAAFNSASVIAVLIASKSDVNAQGFLQQTPLHRAAEMNEEAVPLLLEAKANVNILDKKQRSPLFFAAKRKHEQSVILLCKAGADPNLGVSPLNHYSIDDSMKALIKKHRERWELLNWTIFYWWQHESFDRKVQREKKIKRVFLAAKIEHEQNVILLCKARVDPSLRISPLEESSKQLAPSLLLAASSPIH